MKHVLICMLLTLGIVGSPCNAMAEEAAPAAPGAAPAAPDAPPVVPAAALEHKNEVSWTLGTYRLLSGSTNFGITTGVSCYSYVFFGWHTQCDPIQSPVPATIHPVSRGVIGAEYERAFGHWGFSYGATLFEVQNDFATPTRTPTQGIVQTTFLLATFNKYFGTPNGLQPFIGIGLGMADSSFGGSFNKISGGGLAEMARIGVRYQSGRISVKAGYRFVHANASLSPDPLKIGSITGQYSVSGRGVYAGVGFNF